MNQTEALNNLRLLGFLDSEIKTYIAALELGPSTVIQLNQKTNLSSQAIYTAIESLIKQGLMSSVEKGKRTFYAAESPERLESIAEAKLKSMESTVDIIKKTSKKLKLLQQGDKPIVKLFEGKEGLVSMVEDMARSKTKNIDYFINDDAYAKIFTPEETLPIKKTLDELGIQTRLIALSSTPLQPDRKTTKAKQIKRKDLKFDGDLLIYDNKVALSSFKNKMIGVVIESQEIADTLRGIFQIAWDERM